MSDPSAMMRTALRYLVARAGGHVTITAEGYREVVPEGKHFHMTGGSGKLELFVTDAKTCPLGDAELEGSEAFVT